PFRLPVECGHAETPGHGAPCAFGQSCEYHLPAGPALPARLRWQVAIREPEVEVAQFGRGGVYPEHAGNVRHAAAGVRRERESDKARSGLCACSEFEAVVPDELVGEEYSLVRREKLDHAVVAANVARRGQLFRRARFEWPARDRLGRVHEQTSQAVAVVHVPFESACCHPRGGRRPVALREVAYGQRLPHLVPYGGHLGIGGDSACIAPSLARHNERRQSYTTRWHAELHVHRLTGRDRDYIGQERFESDAPGSNAIFARRGELEQASAAGAGDSGGYDGGLARC